MAFISDEDMAKLEATQQPTQKKFISDEDMMKLEQPETEEPSLTEAITRGAISGITGGLGPMAGAGTQTAYEGIKDVVGIEPMQKSILERYRELRDATIAANEASSEAYPIASLASEIGGAALTAPLTGAVGALRATGLEGAKLAAIAGAKYGAVSGLGTSKADLTKGEIIPVIKDVGEASVMGGVLGAGLSTVPAGIKAYSDDIKDVVKDKMGNMVAKISDGFKFAKAEKSIIGKKAAIANAREVVGMAKEIKDFIVNTKTDARSEINPILDKNVTKGMLTKLDSSLDDVNKMLKDMAEGSDDYNLYTSVKKKLENLKDEFVTNPLEAKGNNKEEILKKLTDKRNEILFKNELGVPEDKALDALGNKATLKQLKDPSYTPSDLQLEKVQTTFNLPDKQTALDFMREYATTKQAVPLDEMGGRINVQDLAVLIKKYQPSDISEQGNRLYFRHGPNVISDTFAQPKQYSAGEMNRQRIFDVQQELYDTARGKTDPKGTISKVARGFRDELESTMTPEELEVFKDSMSKYTKSYTLEDLLTKNKLLSKNVADTTKGKTGTAARIESLFTPYKSKGQLLAEHEKDTAMDILKELNPTYARDFASRAEEAAAKFDISGGSVAQSGGISLERLGKTIEGLGTGVAAMLGTTANYAGKVANMPKEALILASQKATNPNIKNLLSNIANAETETKKKALMFSAMQNPDIRENMKPLFFNENEE